MTTVRRFNAEDHDAVIALFEASAAHTNGAYPPMRSVAAAGGVAGWVGSRFTHRWVAVDTSGSVVGHVALAEPEPTYPAGPLWADGTAAPFLELVRLIVHPADRGRGAAQELLATATAECPTDRHVLCVLEQQTDAQRLYRRLGWQDLGTFTGRSGAALRAFARAKNAATETTR